MRFTVDRPALRRTLLLLSSLTLCSLVSLVSTVAAQDSGDAVVIPKQASADDGTPTSAQESSNTPAPTLSDDGSLSAASAESSSSQHLLAVAPVQTSQPTAGKFQWKPAVIQAVEYTMFSHVWRAAFDPSLRYQLAHKPFFYDWFASYAGYDMHRWSDGDDFLVNDVGHPLEGGVFGRLFLQNKPDSLVQIGKNSRYWKSRLTALGWMAFWSMQFEIGPLSETSFGNQGGYTYVSGCGTYLSCLNNPKYPSSPTNNTGWTDFVITPVVGLGWILAEDTIDKYIVTPVAARHRIFGGRILRSALEPTRSMGALFAGKFPWMLPAAENNFVYHARPKPAKIDEPGNTGVQRWEIGMQYTNVSLPALTSNCTAPCRQSFSGTGANFDYNLTRGIAIDGTMSFIPAQQGSKPMMEGLFGMKMGERFEHVGIFAKVRPGFIYYQNALPGGGDPNPTSLARFAWDFGGIVEVYPHRNSTIRFDVGTTLVRYLSDHTDPRMSELDSLQSSQYIVNQGNFQISTGYTYRF